MKYSKEIVIGLTTFAAIVCFIWGYNFLRGKNVFTPKRDYYVFYDNVHGLEVGQPVTINGFKIGQVTEITFDYKFNGPLLVSFHITEPIEFTKDTKVQIYDMDIMGSKGLQVELGFNENMAAPGDTLYGDIKISLTEKLTKQFVPLKSGTEQLVLVLDSTLRSISTLANTTNRLIELNHNSFSSAISNLDSLTASFNAELGSIHTILNNLNRISEDLLQANMDDAVENLNKTLININTMVTQVNSGSGTLGKLVHKEELHTEMNKTIKSLELLLNDLRTNPKRYVHFSLFGRKEAASKNLN